MAVGIMVGGVVVTLISLWRRRRRATALARCLNLDDYQTAARKVLSTALYEYLASGTDLHENRAAWKRYFLRPRMMRDVSELSTETALFGKRLSMPIFISPAGVHKLCDPEGECASARAAAATGTLFGLSQHATCTIEEVAASAPDSLRWFQVYILKDREVTLELVRRAEAAGYSGLFLTVDSVALGSREADARNGFSGLPPPLCLANYSASERSASTDQTHAAWDQNTEAMFSAVVAWEDVAWLKHAAPSLPLVVKGILTAEDACCALEAGADGVMVSNHGGRQCDATCATIDVLEEVVSAVRAHPRGGPTCPVLLDSGVRRGTDVIKALALGATAVGVGKPVFFSLAVGHAAGVGGQAGVEAVLRTLQREVQATMALCGCARVADVTRGLVAHRPMHPEYVRRPL